MNTPSTPFEKARSICDRSTLPVHMTRMSLTSVVYCSLETPARSAAPYPHQWHTKPNILGLNLSPAPIRSHPPAGSPFYSFLCFYTSPTASSICCAISSPGTAASIWLKTSSSVKCLRQIAFVAHTVLQRPSPLQSTGLTLAFLPCGVL